VWVTLYWVPQLSIHWPLMLTLGWIGTGIIDGMTRAGSIFAPLFDGPPQRAMAAAPRTPMTLITATMICVL
jgi:hypothetical protein